MPKESFLKRLPWYPYEAWAGLWFVLLMLLSALWALPIYLIFGAKAHRTYFVGYKIWARLWFLLAFIDFRRKGMSHRNPALPAVITANHSCHLDLLNGAAVSPIRVKALAKVELRKIPVLGLMFQTASVFVDRSSPQSREASFQALQQTLAKGYSLFMFPEGSRNRSQELLRPFYDGAFRLAVTANRPILPLVFTGTTQVMPMQGIKLRPGRITAHFLAPEWPNPQAQNPVEELRNRVFQQMENTLIKEAKG